MSPALNLLRLLQLADSALPIGGFAHSFGLETLIEEGHLEAAGLFDYLRELLTEGLLLEAVFCRAAHAGGDAEDLSNRLSALRLARETREAGLALGRRFVALMRSVEPAAAPACGEMHFAVAFGCVCGRLELEVEATVSAFLQQSIGAGISVCQRLLRLGQVEAAQIAWDLKPLILEATAQSAALSVAEVGCFAHLPELASMRHPLQPTRLFLS